jgi:diacylglycerol kinase (CTP)
MSVVTNRASGRASGHASGRALRSKSDIHISRKIWHCTGVCLMATVYSFGATKVVWTALLVFSAIIIPLDFLRLKNPALNKTTLKVLGRVMRKHESEKLSALSYLLLGGIFLMWLNKPHLVTLTLLMQAFGDPIASFFGVRYGKDRILGSKTLQGSIAAFVVCGVIAGLYYYFNNLMIERFLIVVPLSGLIGAAGELIPIGKLDDNLSFPILCSLMLWGLFTIFGGFAV